MCGGGGGGGSGVRDALLVNENAGCSEITVHPVKEGQVENTSRVVFTMVAPTWLRA